MPLHERRKISDCGAFIDCVTTDKFRFASFSLSFFLGDLSFSQRQALYALSRMMENGSREYPTLVSLDIALSMLYDAEISFTFTETESGVLFHAEADFANTPTLGEDLLCRILTHVKDTILFPFPEDDGGEALLQRMKEEIRGDCAVLASDPDSYSYSAYKDAVYSSSASRLTEEGIKRIYGDVSLSDVRKIHETVANAPLVYAFYIGRDSADRVSDEICSRFEKRSSVSVTPLSPRRADGSDKFTGEQTGSSTRLYLGFSYGCSDIHASLLALYLGGIPTSRLYTVLREENRYCYSVYAERPTIGLLTLCAAVEPRAEKRSREIMLSALDEVKRGEVDGELLSAVKQAALVSAKYIYESRRTCERFFFTSFVKRAEPDNEVRMRMIEEFDAQALKNAAESVRLCAEYVLPALPRRMRGLRDGNGEEAEN